MDEQVHVIKFDEEALKIMENLSSSIEKLCNQLGVSNHLHDERRDIERNIFANILSGLITGM